MYRPNEEKYDQYYLSFAAIIIAIAVLALFGWSHAPTAVKYKTLSTLGEQSNALISTVSPNLHRSKRQLAHNMIGAFDDYQIKVVFTASDNSFNQSVTVVEGKRQRIGNTNKFKYVAPYEAGQSIQITYWPRDPALIYPTIKLERLAFDWTVFSRILITIGVLLILLVWRINSLKKLQAKLRYY